MKVAFFRFVVALVSIAAPASGPGCRRASGAEAQSVTDVPTGAPDSPAASGETVGGTPREGPEIGGGEARGAEQPPGADDPYREARERMVMHQIEAMGVSDERVLRAMRAVPRHRFVPEDERSMAYADTPLPIGHDQTISQPYIVAEMTVLARVEPGDKVLEIGTGSGYQAAVLAEMGARVFTIEIIPALARSAQAVLESLGYGDRIAFRTGDGYVGWPEEAPFDAVIVTAAPPAIPDPLIEQLARGGTLVVPVGTWMQDLVVVEKDADGRVRRRSVLPVRFVPMTGEAQGE